ncbi:tigger transposable element-derived protein 2-like [Galendromus occidentalis]|uniref:Tigger transposable element-derived protein 2-like n=1 Tax=Galendromus occidentalis TaxID=34638 RepID=A0AAJ6VWN4_9ACAR|nr:tigger transposable element-derived protein 2-like [Galendromus occidentalis]
MIDNHLPFAFDVNAILYYRDFARDAIHCSECLSRIAILDTWRNVHAFVIFDHWSFASQGIAMESGRKKRTVLTLQQKKEILVCLDQGELQATLAKKFGVDKSTICYIKKNADQIRRYVQSRSEQFGPKDAKVMKTAENELLDAALFLWFLQKRHIGFPLSGPIICAKALELYPKLGGTRDFRASNGTSELSTLEFIYNGDETGLYYRALPSRSLAARNERSAPGRKASKDRVTVMTCANATGNHRIPILLIGRSQNPRCFRGASIPLVYRAQRKSWMSRDIFVDWYENTFTPAVEAHQKIIGKEGNVLLILDNAPSHAPLTTMETKNGKFTVTFLPPNVTAILQPMDQGVIVALKRLYRKQLMFRMLCLIENDAAAASGNLSKLIDLKDCCLMLSQAWASVRTSTLRNAWNKLMPIGFGGEPAFMDDSFEIAVLGENLRQDPRFAECDATDIEEWLDCDSEETGNLNLNDEEIIEQVLAAFGEGEGPQEDFEETSDDEEVSDTLSGLRPTPMQAVEAFDTAIRWLRSQEECEAEDLLRLIRLRDVASVHGRN